MAFIPHTKDDDSKQPWELIAAGDITPAIGLALKFTSGYLEICSGTTKPEYICMCEGATLTEGDVIPVIRVNDGTVYKTKNQAAFTNIKIGDKVTLHTDGLQVTATTASGVAEVVGFSGTDTGSDVFVRF